MNIKKLTALILSMLFLVGCGKSNPQPTNTNSDVEISETNQAESNQNSEILPSQSEVNQSNSNFGLNPDGKIETIAYTKDDQPEGFGGYESFITEMAKTMPADETIWREAVLDPNDPENIDDQFPEYGNPDFSVEGKVYANDRKISIEIPSKWNDKPITISFGYISGGYNQYLYLNPVCSMGDSANPIGIYTTVRKDTSERVFTRNPKMECKVPNDIYSGDNPTSWVHNYAIIGQTYDNLASAEYTDITTPGLMWFTSSPLQSDFGEVYFRFLDLNSSTLIALVKVVIAKNPTNGTYYLHHAENMDLLAKGGTEDVSQETLDEAILMVKDVIADGWYPMYKNPADLDNCYVYIDYLGEDRNFYFPQGRPIFDKGEDKMVSMQGFPTPALAVTFSDGTYRHGPQTVYFGIFGNMLQVMATDFMYSDSHETCLERYADEAGINH